MARPLVLAGPILRRVELNRVVVWIALGMPATVRLKVWPGLHAAHATKLGEIAGDDPHPLRETTVEALRFGSATLEQRAIHPAVGTVLGSDGPLRLREEELPGEGFGVERTFQLARWMRGRTVAWSARRRTAGSGPVSSGLRFDDVTRAPRPPPP